MSNSSGLKKMAALWALRAVLRPKGFANLRKGRHWDDEDIFRLIGLDHLIDVEMPRAELKRQLSSRLEKVEAAAKTRRGIIFRNLHKLAEMLRLTEAEREILLFSLALHEEDGLQTALGCLGDVTLEKLVEELAAIIKLERGDVQESISKTSTLCSSGLLQISRQGGLSIPDRLEPLDGLSLTLQDTYRDIEAMLFTYFYKSPPARLTQTDYPHLADDIEIVCKFIGAACEKKLSGVNVLFYGPPGTGKTELARMVAQELECQLYEVSSENDNGEPAEERRFKSYCLCQRLFSRRSDCLVLFDEAEDVFPYATYGQFGLARKSGTHKGWTNRTLENNQVPALWISNDIEQIDPAFIRRFDFILDVPVPPLDVRKKIIEGAVPHLRVSEKWLDTMAANESLAPSHIEKAARVAALVSTADVESMEAVLSRVINHAHKAMGVSGSRQKMLSPAHYDLKFINADFDLAALIESCKRCTGARICLYGPPGSGKTAFVNYMAGQIGKRILVRRASDILGSYVGQTEHRIAEMFDQAAREGSMLLLDEADSFLQDRTRAHHSWEITQVNELLVQMESFDGLFFCATNLMSSLDSAVFRRFDLKIRLDYLTHAQVLFLFENTLIRFGKTLVPSDLDHWRRRLETFGRLTPGDFEAVRRRLSLMSGDVHAEMLFVELSKEISTKPGKHKPISGFLREPTTALDC